MHNFFLFRFALMSRMVLGVGKKSEIRLKSENYDPCNIEINIPILPILSGTFASKSIAKISLVCCAMSNNQSVADQELTDFQKS